MEVYFENAFLFLWHFCIFMFLQSLQFVLLLMLGFVRQWAWVQHRENQATNATNHWIFGLKPCHGPSCPQKMNGHRCQLYCPKLCWKTSLYCNYGGNTYKDHTVHCMCICDWLQGFFSSLHVQTEVLFKHNYETHHDVHIIWLPMPQEAAETFWWGRWRVIWLHWHFEVVMPQVLLNSSWSQPWVLSLQPLQSTAKLSVYCVYFKTLQLYMPNFDWFIHGYAKKTWFTNLWVRFGQKKSWPGIRPRTQKFQHDAPRLRFKMQWEYSTEDPDSCLYPWLYEDGMPRMILGLPYRMPLWSPCMRDQEWNYPT